MNKEYLMNLVRQRITELESAYRSYFDLDNGPSKSYSGAACARSRIKKDLGTLRLLEYLLMYCPDSMTIDNQEICDAFDRLTEPRKLK
jgi:hypothetical protein